VGASTGSARLQVSVPTELAHPEEVKEDLKKKKEDVHEMTEY